MTTTLTRSLAESVQVTRTAARTLAKLPTQAKDAALEAIAIALEQNGDRILQANQKDVEAAKSAQLPIAILNRLKLDRNKLASMVAGVRDMVRLAEPVGITQIHRELDTGLTLERITCPLGVVGVIFEARPDAVSQIAALAIKSGNGVILKGGSEAVNSCEAIVAVIHQALKEAEIGKELSVSPDAIQLLTTRAETLAILQMDSLIDLIIPRGSNQFVRYIQENTRIPVLGHAEGICHLYVDASAEIAQAIAIAVDAKAQYPAACNAIETLLVHAAIAANFLPFAVQALQNHGVEVRVCDRTLQIMQQCGGETKELLQATDSDWATEYSDLILAIRIVDSLEEAIAHINTYGSRHTEAIVTQDPNAAATFLSDVDAAGVFHNCSTRFADGFRYGFGAEVGISTQKMPPRGPVGLEGLITYKYRLIGDGHIVASYSGKDAKTFTHKDLT
ncbi:glutamate-5-semialdehyde dehydrogenase [Tumidithrix elongata RA019]|uniref:Gamma-glutamyl phosphate reductase n=1 Tax=Tumidithrix elongata BACA0141 TaxID=2716417 RepID=A0AAW9Q161_9CYAN|nr:glutamate-5-semialdehyde dehydrogenase [Tumidithrix elongata RA019]